MFDFRLRLCSDTGVRGRVLDALTTQVTTAESGTAVLTFTTSEAIAGSLPEAPFLVVVEYSTGGGWVEPRNSRLIVGEDSADAAAPDGSISFTARAFVPELFRKNLVWTIDTTDVKAGPVKDRARTWTDVASGHLIAQLITEAQGRGWGPLVTADFDRWNDSNSLPWPAEDLISPSYTLDTPVSQVLSKLAEQGLCEWWTEGFTIRMFRAGTGLDLRDEIVLGGPAATRTPSKTSFDGVFTHLHVVPSDTASFTLENTGADTRWGRLEATMSQAGVSDLPTAQKLAQPALTSGRAVQREISHEWDVTTGPRPWADFNIGDVVMSRGRVKRALRVIGIQVTKDAAGVVSCRAVVGDKLLSLTAKIAARAGAATFGTIIGGSGDAFPATPGVASPNPKQVTGLHVASNVGAWRADGTAESTVNLGWNAVTQSVDDAPIDVAEYEVWSRQASELASRTTTTATPSVDVSSWAPGVLRLVKVRAVAHSGKQGEFSGEISVTPAIPASVIPKPPAGLLEISNVGSFDPYGRAVAKIVVAWDAVHRSTDNLPIVVQDYLVELEDGTVWATHATVTSPLQASFTILAGRAQAVRVSARTSLGVVSDPSIVLTVTGGVPTALGPPSKPTLETGLGFVITTWDGELAAGPAGPYLAHVLVEVDPGTGWKRLAMPITFGGGAANYRSRMDATVRVRLIAVDSLGRESAPSEVEEINVIGVDGPDIKVGAIEVNHLSPAVGPNLDLSANGQVTILVGQAASLQDSITTQQGQIEAQNAQLAAIQSGVSAAGIAASDASTAAAAAQAAAAAAQASVDMLGLAVVVTPVDVQIRRPGAQVALHMANDNMSFRRNGIAQTWWDEQQMIVPKLKANQIVLGETVIDATSSRTTWRRLS